MGCSELQSLKMLTATIHFHFSKKLLDTLQIFQNKIQQVLLKNFNFKIVKKIKQVTENKHRFSQNFGWGILHPQMRLKVKNLKIKILYIYLLFTSCF